MPLIYDLEMRIHDITCVSMWFPTIYVKSMQNIKILYNIALFPSLQF